MNDLKLMFVGAAAAAVAAWHAAGGATGLMLLLLHLWQLLRALTEPCEAACRYGVKYTRYCHGSVSSQTDQGGKPHVDPSRAMVSGTRANHWSFVQCIRVPSNGHKNPQLRLNTFSAALSAAKLRKFAAQP
jgi:hypothetical protein